MYLRPYTRADVSEAADVLCAAFRDDAHFSFRVPYGARYPLAYRTLALQKHKDMLLGPYAYGFVYVADAGDACRLTAAGDGRSPFTDGTILGYAWWARCSPAPSQDPWIHGRHDFWSYAIERDLLSIERLYEHYKTPNPAVSPRKEKLVNAALATDKNFAMIFLLQHWHLGPK